MTPSYSHLISVELGPLRLDYGAFESVEKTLGSIYLQRDKFRKG